MKSDYSRIMRAIDEATHLTEAEIDSLIEALKSFENEHYNYNNHYEGSNTREIRGDY